MYYVEVVSFDLRHEETILQAINALDYLQASIDNAFDIIDKRIADDNEKINSIKSRINIVSKKVKKISLDNKAIKILAPPKFPAANVLGDISVSFGTFTKISPDTYLDYEIDNIQSQCHNAFQNKLVFYHVKNQRRKYNTSKVLLEKPDVCLIPNYLNYANSILLSNIFESNFSSKHFQNVITHKYQDSTRAGWQQIVAAPTSITNRQISDNHSELLYMPKLSGAPNLNLPIDLPDLPGIAVDVQFDLKVEPHIAPSLYIEKSSITKIKINEINSQNINEIKSPNLNDIKYPNVIVEPKMELKIDKKLEVTQSIPPPPPLLPLIVQKEEKAINKLPAIDSRSNLMDAIRKAGGAKGGKLRASNIVEKTEKKSSHNGNSIACNLLDDLHNKLLMRRKGISGTRQTTDSVIERLSEVIPPLSDLKKDSSSETTDNEEWD